MIIKRDQLPYIHPPTHLLRVADGLNSLVTHWHSYEPMLCRSSSYSLRQQIRLSRCICFLYIFSTAAAQIQLAYPDTIVGCQPNNISWTGGSPPFSLFVHTAIGGVVSDESVSLCFTASGQASLKLLGQPEIYPGIKESHWVWNGDLQPGLPIKFQLADSKGISEWTPTLVIARGTKTDCSLATTSASSALSTSSSTSSAEATSPSTSVPTITSHSSTGPLVGGVIGGLAFLAIFFRILYLVIRRKRRTALDEGRKAHPFTPPPRHAKYTDIGGSGRTKTGTSFSGGRRKRDTTMTDELPMSPADTHASSLTTYPPITVVSADPDAGAPVVPVPTTRSSVEKTAGPPPVPDPRQRSATIRSIPASNNTGTSLASPVNDPEMMEVWRREIREEVRREVRQQQATLGNLSEYSETEAPPEYVQRESIGNPALAEA